MHDALQAHHDKDFRCLAAFPLEELKGKNVYVWRINRWNHLEIDLLVGAGAQPSRTSDKALVIQNGHMRVVKEPSGYTFKELTLAWEARGKQVREFLMQGWTANLEAAKEAPVMSSTPPPCLSCQSNSQERVQARTHDRKTARAGESLEPEQANPLLRLVEHAERAGPAG